MTDLEPEDGSYVAVSRREARPELQQAIDDTNAALAATQAALITAFASTAAMTTGNRVC